MHTAAETERHSSSPPAARNALASARTPARFPVRLTTDSGLSPSTPVVASKASLLRDGMNTNIGKQHTLTRPQVSTA